MAEETECVVCDIGSQSCAHPKAESKVSDHHHPLLLSLNNHPFRPYNHLSNMTEADPEVTNALKKLKITQVWPIAMIIKTYSQQSIITIDNTQQ